MTAKKDEKKTKPDDNQELKEKLTSKLDSLRSELKTGKGDLVENATEKKKKPPVIKVGGLPVDQAMASYHVPSRRVKLTRG